MKFTIVFALLALSSSATSAFAEPPDRDTNAAETNGHELTDVLIIVGPSTHPPGSHEVAAGGRLMAWCLSHARNLDAFRVTVAEGWPDVADDSDDSKENDHRREASILDTASTVVFIGDTFPPQRLPETQAILTKVDQMMNRGCGIVCVHYATGLLGKDVPADGNHPLLGWMGGYFANKTCHHHQGVARVYASATIQQASPEHPISQGWSTFTLHDEPYINNYFGTPDNRLADNVTPLATSMLPPEDPKQETVAWCVQRERGRGFAIVMPHFYKNWSDDDLRRLILNGIVWTAGREVPEGGVATDLPELEQFAPESVEAQPRH